MEPNTNPNSSAAAAPQGNPAPDNLSIYNLLRGVPDEAKKSIVDGRLKGKTDINPMWRIKKLTEVFGPAGFGWKITIKNKWLEKGDDDTVAAFVDVDLYVKNPQTGEWSEAIPGTGGNVFRRKENSGKNYIDDDCYKKALTDAISIAAKFLGVAADVYYEKDPTSKYETDSSQKGQASVRSRSTAQPAAQPAAQAQPASKPVLSKSSPYWLSSITTAMSTTDSVQKIRARIEKKFSISDADFLELMKAAGKVPAEAKAI